MYNNLSQLQVFQLVNHDKVISPGLITIREYGRWFEKFFDEYTSQAELYLHSKKKGGEVVLEWHPGTRIGSWFDKNKFNNANMISWFIFRDSPMMDRLVKLNMAEYKDTVPISVHDEQGRQMLRVYTTQQIELYIRQNLDKSFSISKCLGVPKQIKLKDCDKDKVIMPKVANTRRKLFN